MRPQGTPVLFCITSLPSLYVIRETRRLVNFCFDSVMSELINFCFHSVMSEIMNLFELDSSEVEAETRPASLTPYSFQDALRILASKELRITGARASSGNADLEEDDGGAAAAITAVKGRVVTQLMKKNLVQNAVPIFIELKRYHPSKHISSLVQMFEKSVIVTNLAISLLQVSSLSMVEQLE